MPIFPSFFVNKTGGYEIEQSLRFAGGSTQYLYRTGAITAQGGVSLWVKFHRDVGSFTSGVYDPIIYLSGGGPWLYRNGYGYLYYRSISSGGDSTWSAQRTRDHSAWYHIFLKFNSSNSTSLYVNNVLWGTKTANIGTSSSNQRVGYDGTYRAQYYLAEYHAAFGESLDPTDFGEYDANGVWVPKKFTGNYGSQGFYLKFDPSAANGLGHDHSGNGNHFTDAGGFTTSGTGTDVMSDTPTTNYATINPLETFNGRWSNAPTNGNLEISIPSDSTLKRNYPGKYASIVVPTTGKYYFEFETSNQYTRFVAVDVQYSTSVTGGNDLSLTDKKSVQFSVFDGNYYYNGATNSTASGHGGNSAPSGDIYGVAIDLENGTLRVDLNGTAGTELDISSWAGESARVAAYISASSESGTIKYNFGAQGFAYTPPTGFKALNTSNLPAPTIKEGSDYFNTVTYSGDNSSPRTISTVGFQSDFVWVKNRTDTGPYHMLTDAVRGGGKTLFSNDTIAEVTNSGAGYISGFATNGFELTAGGSGSANVNATGKNYVAWNWLAGGSGSSNTDGSITSTVSANPTAGFSIVSYTGNVTSGATIGHGLGIAPSLVIVKDRDSGTQPWRVYHSSLGATKALRLNEDTIQETDTAYWNDTAPSSTVVTLGNDNSTNASGDDYIAYCFAEVEGYSKISEFTGNGSTDGSFVYCGFKPSWILLRRYANSRNWYLYDAARNTFNVVGNLLYPDLSNSEASADALDILSNGFKMRTTNTSTNGSGDKILFVAFASHPFGGSGVSPATAR